MKAATTARAARARAPRILETSEVIELRRRVPSSATLDSSLDRWLPPHEKAVVDAALAVLAARWRRPLVNNVGSPALAKEYARLQLAQFQRECMAGIFLNAHAELIAFEIISQGSLTSAPIYCREFARRALQLNARAVIAVHNHPSGSANPSDDDTQGTRALRMALELIGVDLPDHIVVGWPEVVSMAELGRM